MIRITATKGKLTAAFGVDIKRTSYFFRDRRSRAQFRGSTTHIFHIVRPHVRKNGKAVPMHFRGLREFEWAGHKIKISVPGRDHFHLTEWDVGSIPESMVKDKKSVLFTGQVADRLNRRMNEGLGALATEISSHRNVTLMSLIGEVGGHVADLVRWPDSQATKTTLDNSMTLLRKAFKENGYPHAFTYMAMLQIASDAYSHCAGDVACARETVNGDVRPQALKQAWIKIGDLLYKEKT